MYLSIIIINLGCFAHPTPCKNKNQRREMSEIDFRKEKIVSYAPSYHPLSIIQVVVLHLSEVKL